MIHDEPHCNRGVYGSKAVPLGGVACNLKPRCRPNTKIKMKEQEKESDHYKFIKNKQES